MDDVSRATLRALSKPARPVWSVLPETDRRPRGLSLWLNFRNRASWDGRGLSWTTRAPTVVYSSFAAARRPGRRENRKGPRNDTANRPSMSL